MLCKFRPVSVVTDPNISKNVSTRGLSCTGAWECFPAPSARGRLQPRTDKASRGLEPTIKKFPWNNDELDPKLLSDTRLNVFLNFSLIAHLKGLDALIKNLWSVLMCSQNFSFYYEKAFFARLDPRWYRRYNISKNSQPISTNKIWNESLSLQLLILRIINKNFFF